MDKKFKTAVLGGTFDHLHRGHKEFIKFALFLSEEVIIGLTSNEYVENSKGKNLEEYETRKETLENFLEQENLIDRTQIIEIDDVYGIATSARYQIDALVVVEKTLAGADKINTKRKELELPPLEVIVAPSVLAQDGKEISSSRIRNGEIDREGKLWINPQWLTQNLILPESLREEFKKPFGQLITHDNLGNLGTPVVAVGDITTQKLNKLSLDQKISIIDFNVNREKRFDKISQLGFPEDMEIIRVDNPAGQITPALFLAIIKSLSIEGRVIIEVLGEEDLSVLCAVLATPLGATVFYGQPDEGVVKVNVSEELKEKAYSFVDKFITRGH